jgi:hypothetical protein
VRRVLATVLFKDRERFCIEIVNNIPSKPSIDGL